MGHHLSLLHGWLPLTAQVLTVATLIAAIGWRTRRWRLLWLPMSAIVGVAVACGARWYLATSGMAGEPAPQQLWWWVGLTCVAILVVVFGWRSAQWWRRAVSVIAVPLCFASAAVSLNQWVGYFPTVQTAWNQVTDGQLPDQTDQATVVSMVAHHTVPSQGSLVPVTIPATNSGFQHRQEMVYLPPAWFASSPPPALPAVMMIGGEFNTPADWVRVGEAVTADEDFAKAHDGYAPVLVFADPGGMFKNDTECVNGPHGNSADHLTKDVIPWVVSNYGVSSKPANWGVVGFSMGGTCAVDLTVMHPELFSAFEDISGDYGPNMGDKAQTIDRLYGGNAAAWDTFDPATVITKHGQYSGVTGWFDVNGEAAALRVDPATAPPGDPQAAHPGEQMMAATSLCALGSANGIACTVQTQPGKHDWPFASQAFSVALPWLASQLGTPHVASTALPGTSPTE